MITTQTLFGTNRVVDLLVYVYQRPHMRDAQLEYELHMGRRVLDGIFDEQRMMPDVTTLSLSFPENWTNIIEQRILYKRLGYYCPNLTKLTIKTQSVYIIQCTPANSIRIVQFDEPSPDEIMEDGSLNLTGKTWLPMTGNVFGSGITILNGK